MIRETTTRCGCRVVREMHPITKKILETYVIYCQSCFRQRMKDRELLRLAIKQDMGTETHGKIYGEYIVDENGEISVNEQVRANHDVGRGFDEDSWLDVEYDDDDWEKLDD